MLRLTNLKTNLNNIRETFRDIRETCREYHLFPEIYYRGGIVATIILVVLICDIQPVWRIAAVISWVLFGLTFLLVPILREMDQSSVKIKKEGKVFRQRNIGQIFLAILQFFLAFTAMEITVFGLLGNWGLLPFPFLLVLEGFFILAELDALNDPRHYRSIQDIP